MLVCCIGFTVAKRNLVMQQCIYVRKRLLAGTQRDEKWQGHDSSTKDSLTAHCMQEHSARMRARPALGFWDYSHKHCIDLCTFNRISVFPTSVRHFTYRSVTCSNSHKNCSSRYYFLPFCVKLCFRSLSLNLLERHWLGSYSSEWKIPAGDREEHETKTTDAKWQL